AVLAEPPAVLASQYDPAHRSLLDILSSAPEKWRPYLALLIARYADTVAAWQLGRDGDDAFVRDPRSASAGSQVRNEVDGVSSDAEVAAPLSLLHPAARKELSDAFSSVSIPQYIVPKHLPAHLAPFVSSQEPDVWVSMEPVEAKRYTAPLRLADLAR